MQLTINGVPRQLIPLARFRAQHNLPDDFGLATLQPKQRSAMGSVDGAAAALNQLRTDIVACVPTQSSATAWLNTMPLLADTFERQLRRLNQQVALSEAELLYAVQGFEAVCGEVATALARAHYTGAPLPSFEQLYGAWLLSTVRVGYDPIAYTHGDEQWHLRIVRHAYGRVGLQVQTPDATYYVADRALACPAEGVMATLLRAVAEQMIAATPLPHKRAS